MAGGGGGGDSGGLTASLPLYADLLLAALIVCISAFFAGSTLGLLSLDKVGLQIIASGSDSEKERKHARTILPVRERGNWLLCTLLIGNTIANSFLSILLASVSSGILGLVVSTALIVIFAEIIPQSICSRHGLAIGARTVYLIWACMFILYPLARPLAFILDKVLGREVGNIYTRKELKELLAIHVENADSEGQTHLSKEDHQILSGALDYKDKTVADVMTPMEKVYMIEAHVRLSFDNMLEVYKSGYTRIPVYDTIPQRIIGILYVKDLILVDPDDEIEIRTLVSFHGKSTVQYILDITPLNEVFTLFKTSHTHLMVACRLTQSVPAKTLGVNVNIGSVRSQQNFLSDVSKEVTGVITLEDVLEEVIQDEIVDEHDRYESNDHAKAVDRRTGRDRPDASAYLSMFEHKLRHECRLSNPEVQAVAAFLSTSVPAFSQFSHNDNVLRGLVRQADVVEWSEASADEEGMGTAHSAAPAAPEEHAHKPREVVLYKRGTPSTLFTLVLQGHIQVRAGAEAFVSELGPWSCLGDKALRKEIYVPDFDAHTAGTGRLLRISAEAYTAAVRMGHADSILGTRHVKKVLSTTTLSSGALASGPPPLNANAILLESNGAATPRSAGGPASAPASPAPPGPALRAPRSGLELQTIPSGRLSNGPPSGEAANHVVDPTRDVERENLPGDCSGPRATR